jgi:Rps23 Pro-64 3,4-dihydroxylase Tpa1-like proline 4-hydroxylase
MQVHTDFNTNYHLNLERRVNLFVYLNRDWEDGYGGELQLWDDNMTRCERHILPLFNRLVVFSTTNISYHGHPDPLMAPDDRSRLSIAQYYYTNGRPASEQAQEHTTVFRARPGHLDETDQVFYP